MLLNDFIIVVHIDSGDQLNFYSKNVELYLSLFGANKREERLQIIFQSNQLLLSRLIRNGNQLGYDVGFGRYVIGYNA